MIEEIGRQFILGGFLPHGYCLSWSPPLVGVYIVSDVLIFLAYFSMPLALGYFARRRPDFPYKWLLWMFVAFILACGTTHLMGTIILWQPLYWLDAILKAITALISVATAAVLWPMIPHALRAPSHQQMRRINEELEAEIAERRRVEDALRKANEELVALHRQKDASLAKALHRLDAHMRNSPLAVLEFDADFRIIRWSETAERMFGWRGDEVLGQPVEATGLIHDDDKAGVLQLLTDLKSGTSFRGNNTNRNHRKDGSVLVCEWYNSATYDDEGRLVSTLHLALDVTERLRVESRIRASEEKYRTLFSTMTEAFQLGELIYDGAGHPVDLRYLEVNDAFFQQTGLPKEIVGRPVSEFLPRLEPYWLESLAAVVATGVPKRFTNFNADTQRHYDVYIFRPSPERFAALFQDVTDKKRMEEAMQQSQADLQLLIATLPGMVWTATLDGRIDFLSKQWYDYTGTGETTQMHAVWMECLHPDDRGQLVRLWRRSRADGSPFDTEYRLRRHDGAYRWFSVRGTPLADDDGRRLRWLGVVTDIHELKRTQEELQESELRYKALFNNKTSAIAHLSIVFDEGGKPVDYCVDALNDTYEQVIGIAKEQLVGKRVTEAFPGIRDFDFDFIGEMGRIGQEQGEGSFEFFFPPAGKWISLYAFSPARGAVIAIFNDITAQKTAEATIRQLNADLEKRVEERTAELTAANHELESITYASSHDLRGPLGRISSFSAMLEQRYRDRLEGDGLLFLDFIRQNATRLTLLVDDLLSHARVARQPLALKPVDVPALVSAILDEKESELQAAGVRVFVDVASGKVIADTHAISQALRNLLENALKFSAHAPAPAIEIGSRKQGDRYILHVRDNGVGFDMVYHDRIFEMFRRLHTYNEFEGSGVGLALVKRAMERMGGKVWAESEPGKGATFYLELKAASQLLEA